MAAAASTSRIGVVVVHLEVVDFLLGFVELFPKSLAAVLDIFKGSDTGDELVGQVCALGVIEAVRSCRRRLGHECRLRQ